MEMELQRQHKLAKMDTLRESIMRLENLLPGVPPEDYVSTYRHLKELQERYGALYAQCFPRRTA